MTSRDDAQIVGRHRPKIGPHQALSKETLAAARLNAHMLGPGEPALSEWRAAGLQLPDLDAIRSYRLARVRQTLAGLGYDGLLLYDPVNIRYATDSTNMQVWVAHNPTRYVYVATDGPVVLWDYATSEHLTAHLSLIDEIRTATQWMYMFAGAEYAAAAKRWAGEIAELVRTSGRGAMRIAVDRANPIAIHALEGEGVSIGNGEEVMELARSIKSADEIDALRCAIAACDRAVHAMHGALRPGLTENALWSILHSENIIRFGEWIETRLLSSGPRTNPWFQESSSRVIEAGDLVAFDTDLIGAYGMCVDMSRTWLSGGGEATGEQRRTWEIARDQLEHNVALLRPGITFEELTFRAAAPPSDRYRRYSVVYHGVGLADEWPSIYFPESWEDVGFDGVIEAGMVLCVEAYVGPRTAREGVKLEQQVLVTADGPEVLTGYPVDLT